MSDFLAEARVIVRPDTTKFRALLESELRSATARPIPIAVTPVVVGGLSAATAGTAALIAAQETATSSTLGLANAAQVENSALGKQAVILDGVVAATNAEAIAAERAGVAHSRAAAGIRSHAIAQSQLSKGAVASLASLTGLRGAVLAASAPFLAATVAVTAFTKSVQLAAQLETELNVFKVAVGATAAEMELAAQNARALGRDLSLPGVTAVDAAQAQLQLARAGFEVQQALEGTRGTLQLATAAQIDFGKSAELVAGAVNAFGLSGADATRVADLLTGAANESQGSIEDMGIALRQSAGAAALLGLSVEDTVTLLTQLVKAGLAGSDAGTTLRVALVRLARPDTRAEVEKLVGSLQDLQGNLDPTKIVQLADEIQKSGGKLDQTNRLYELFGENALRVVGLLGQEGVAGFNATSVAITESGLAAENAAARMKGLEGDLESMSNEASAVGTTLGNLASPIISSLAGGTTLALRGVNLLTKGITDLIAPPRKAAESLGDMQHELEQAREDLERFQESGGDSAQVVILQKRVDEAAAAFERFGISAEEAAEGIDIFKIAAGGVGTTITDLIAALNKAGEGAQSPADQGLNVQQILNRVTGFDAAEVRSRIRGDTSEIVSVLEGEQAFLLSQLDRQVVKNRPALKRQLEAALLGVSNDLATLQEQGARETKQAVADAARAKNDADQALLGLLSNRRDDLQRKISAAAETEGLRDDIKRQNQLQALIRQQIQKIRDRITDEKAKKAAIRELRIALIASRQEEDALRAQRRQDAAARKAEGINLDIEFAEITGNTAREIAARQKLIALLRKQQSNVKKGTAEWKRLRNEIAQEQAAIKEARGQLDEASKTGRSFQQDTFDFLQAQQGFAANLFGNLIPGGATGGLVGNVSAAAPAGGTNIDLGIGRAIQQAEGRSQGGVSAGQGNSVIDILRRIEKGIRDLNRSSDAPEANRQRAVGSAAMDGAGGGTMDAAVL